ncbi:RT0821/Lpp0805 family surface protein [Mesorhizobium yinganensis]|uniref:RT0821/Lpp0805 family surface protein n=1 Tax=Mesorhizobium yinganensis TaxID=3157707 RepID=UPI0032B7EB3F
MTGCASGGFSLSKAETDPTILTGSVGDTPAVAVSPEQVSDEATIRNAVSSADVESLKGAPIPWANADTGARGAISSLVEDKSSGTLCRRFVTSRESFDGVALYRGKACMVAPGSWRMERFGAS